MSDKTKIEPWDEVRIRKTDTGWDFCLRKKDGSIVGRLAINAATFDEAVAKAKEEFDVS